MTCSCCLTGCPHLERCLTLEKELSRTTQELTDAKMAGESANNELSTLRAFVSRISANEDRQKCLFNTEKHSNEMLKREVGRGDGSTSLIVNLLSFS